MLNVQAVKLETCLPSLALAWVPGSFGSFLRMLLAETSEHTSQRASHAPVTMLLFSTYYLLSQ